MTTEERERIDLPPMPPRIARLVRDARGYPTPWFVAVIDGVPDFRVADGLKREVAFRDRRCWVCGEALGQYPNFLIGPMCAVNRTTSEPPSHRECAEWSAIACPFLSRPSMKRRDSNLPPDHKDPPGIALPRNPTAVLVWCSDFSRFGVPASRGGGWLIELDTPLSIKCFSRGKPGTLQDALDSIESGYHSLRTVADQDGPEAVKQLEAQRARCEAELRFHLR